jgi:hypothetical protein
MVTTPCAEVSNAKMAMTRDCNVYMVTEIGSEVLAAGAQGLTERKPNKKATWAEWKATTQIQAAGWRFSREETEFDDRPLKKCSNFQRCRPSIYTLPSRHVDDFGARKQPPESEHRRRFFYFIRCFEAAYRAAQESRPTVIRVETRQ